MAANNTYPRVICVHVLVFWKDVYKVLLQDLEICACTVNINFLLSSLVSEPHSAAIWIQSCA